ncbi:MAG TPA: hypothetical protein VNE63_08930 [Candidatus Acidoferrales bacterium]|nr:hypothetical protein [Candidatus Acidoferrales bacterium]
MRTVDKLVGMLVMARAAVNGVIARFEAMPLVMRLVCLASLCAGFMLLVISLLQVGSIRIFDETLSWSQVRAAGYYPFLVGSGLAMVVTGVGIWKLWKWSRWLVVLGYLIPLPIPLIYLRSHPQTGTDVMFTYAISAVVWAGFFYWYLFFKQKSTFV